MGTVLTNRHASPASDVGHVIPVLTDRFSTLFSCLSRLIGREFMRSSLFVRRTASQPGDRLLFVRIHRRKAPLVTASRLIKIRHSARARSTGSFAPYDVLRGLQARLIE